MHANAFDDMHSDLDGAPVRPPVADAPVYTQPCTKCLGSGRYSGPSSRGSVCFKCGGSGVLEFKTSPFERLKSRQAAQRRVERKGADAFEAFKIANPDEAAWIEQRVESFDFARRMRECFDRFGTLTDGQLRAVQKCVVQDRERDEQRAAAAVERQAIAAAAPAVASVGKLEQAFSAALAAGIRYPKLRLDSFVFSPAPAHGKNAGAIYVKEDEAYLGKVIGGRFNRVRECSEEQEARIVTAASDPLAAAVAYGKRFGKCAVCSRDLENEESINLGIGPICRERMGWF